VFFIILAMATLVEQHVKVIIMAKIIKNKNSSVTDLDQNIHNELKIT